MKLRYVGEYAGTVPWLGIDVKPGDEIDVSAEDGEKLLKTKQFESVLAVTLTEKKEEEPEEGGE